MELLKGFLKVADSEMRVDCRGIDVCVTEEFLNRAQICAVLEHVRCEAVPQGMGIDVGDPRAPGRSVENQTDAVGG